MVHDMHTRRTRPDYLQACPTGPPVDGVKSALTPALWPCTFCSDPSEWRRCAVTLRVLYGPLMSNCFMQQTCRRSVETIESSRNAQRPSATYGEHKELSVVVVTRGRHYGHDMSQRPSFDRPSCQLRNRQSTTFQRARNANETLAVIASRGHGQCAVSRLCTQRRTTRMPPGEGVGARSRGGRQRHSL